MKPKKKKGTRTVTKKPLKKMVKKPLTRAKSLPHSVPEVFLGTKAKLWPLFEFVNQKISTIGTFKTRLNGTTIELWRDYCFAAIQVKPGALVIGFHYNGTSREFSKAKNWKIPRITHCITIKRPNDVSPALLDGLQSAYILAAQIGDGSPNTLLG